MSERAMAGGSVESGRGGLNSATRKLFVAIRRDSLEELKEAIAQGAAVSGFNFESVNVDMPPLMTAIYFSNISVCEALLSAGALVDEVDSRKRDALFYAAESSSVELVETLRLRIKASVSQERSAGWLASACGGGNVAVARFLIANGASASKLFEGMDAMMRAAAAGSFECALLALVEGADPRARSEHGRRAVDLARDNGHESVAIELQAAIEALDERRGLGEALGPVNAMSALSRSPSL